MMKNFLTVLSKSFFVVWGGVEMFWGLKMIFDSSVKKLGAGFDSSVKKLGRNFGDFDDEISQKNPEIGSAFMI